MNDCFKMPRTRYFRRPFSYRRYRRYRRTYGRLSRRTRYSRRIVSSRSRLSVRIPWVTTGTLPWTAGQTSTGVICCNALGKFPVSGKNVNMSSIDAPIFDAYANLFDEVKIDGIKCQFSITSPIGGAATIPSCSVISVVDRRANSAEVNPAANEFPTLANMLSYSSVSVRDCVTNSVAKVSRSVWASDLVEKCQFQDSNFSAPAANTKYTDAFYAASYNPNFFCPAVYFCVADLPAPAQGQTASINYRCQMYAYVTFRNPKYAPSASAKNVEERAAAFEEAVQRVAAEHPDAEIDVDVPVDDLLEQAETSGHVVKNVSSDAQPLSSTKMEE